MQSLRVNYATSTKLENQIPWKWQTNGQMSEHLAFVAKTTLHT
jgi:hypothetical protein